MKKGRWWLVGALAGALGMALAAPGTVLRTISVPGGTIFRVAWHPKGEVFYSQISHGMVSVSKTGQVVKVFDAMPDMLLYDLQVSLDGRWLAGMGSDGELVVWNTNSGKRTDLQAWGLKHFGFTDGGKIILNNGLGEIFMYDPAKPQVKAHFMPNIEAHRTFLSYDGRVLFILSNGLTKVTGVRLSDGKTVAELKLNGWDDPQLYTNASGTAAMLIMEKSLKVWNLSTGKLDNVAAAGDRFSYCGLWTANEVCFTGNEGLQSLNLSTRAITKTPFEINSSAEVDVKPGTDLLVVKDSAMQIVDRQFKIKNAYSPPEDNIEMTSRYGSGFAYLNDQPSSSVEGDDSSHVDDIGIAVEGQEGNLLGLKNVDWIWPTTTGGLLLLRDNNELGRIEQGQYRALVRLPEPKADPDDEESGGISTTEGIDGLVGYTPTEALVYRVGQTPSILKFRDYKLYKVRGAALSGGGKTLQVLTRGAVLHEIDLVARKAKLVADLSGESWGMAVNRSGTRAVAHGSFENPSLTFISPQGKVLKSVNVPITPLNTNIDPDSQGATWLMHFSPDGKRLAFSDYRTVRIYDTTTQALVQVLDGFKGFTMSLAWAADSKSLLVGASLKDRISSGTVFAIR